jgi:predicted transcriptional regulator
MSGRKKFKDHESVRSLLRQTVRDACRNLTPINFSDKAELKEQILKRIHEGYYERTEVVNSIMDQIELICGHNPK